MKPTNQDISISLRQQHQLQRIGVLCSSANFRTIGLPVPSHGVVAAVPLRLHTFNLETAASFISKRNALSPSDAAFALKAVSAAVSAGRAFEVPAASAGDDVIEVPQGELFFPDRELRLKARVLLESRQHGPAAAGGASATRELHACVTDGCSCAGVVYKEYGDETVVVEVSLAFDEVRAGGPLTEAFCGPHVDSFRRTQPKVTLTYSEQHPATVSPSCEAASSKQSSVTLPVSSVSEFRVPGKHPAMESDSFDRHGVGVWRVRFRPDKKVHGKPFVVARLSFGRVNAVDSPVFESRTKPSGWLLVRRAPARLLQLTDLPSTADDAIRQALLAAGVKHAPLAAAARLNVAGCRYGFTPDELATVDSSSLSKPLTPTRSGSPTSSAEESPPIPSAKRPMRPTHHAGRFSGEVSRVLFLRFATRSIAKTAAVALQRRIDTMSPGCSAVVSQISSLNREHVEDPSLVSVSVSESSAHCHSFQSQRRPGFLGPSRNLAAPSLSLATFRLAEPWPLNRPATGSGAADSDWMSADFAPSDPFPRGGTAVGLGRSHSPSAFNPSRPLGDAQCIGAIPPAPALVRSGSGLSCNSDALAAALAEALAEEEVTSSPSPSSFSLGAGGIEAAEGPQEAVQTFQPAGRSGKRGRALDEIDRGSELLPARPAKRHEPAMQPIAGAASGASGVGCGPAEESLDWYLATDGLLSDGDDVGCATPAKPPHPASPRAEPACAGFSSSCGTFTASSGSDSGCGSFHPPQQRSPSDDDEGESSSVGSAGDSGMRYSAAMAVSSCHATTAPPPWMLRPVLVDPASFLAPTASAWRASV